MKRMKYGIVALVIAVLAITAAVVGAQPNSGSGSGKDQGQRQGMGRGGEFQVIADTLGIDLATLQTELQSGKTIADLATEKNVELSAIVDAAVAQAQTNLTAEVTAGTLTQEQADARIVLLKANLNALFTRTFDQQSGRPGFGQRGGAMLDVIATALGVDAATLQTDLQAGKTVAEIATEKNVELSVVIDAVVAERQTALTAAVTAGTLTQEQADAQIALLKADLNVRFTQAFNANGKDGMGMGGFGGRGDGGFGGNGGHGGRGHDGQMNPNGIAPVAPDATPEATAAANA